MGKGVRRAFTLAAIGFALSACGMVHSPLGENHVPHPTYKIGAPYTVKGVTYYPHVDYAYDQVGMASWYGEQFEGHYTANGEVFDLDQLTAAHTTLPLPSIVEVINLQNNRELRIRVNDRGPFAKGRIIDLSRRAAELLGFERAGSAMVRVKVLKEPSLYAAKMAERGIVSNGEELLSMAATTAVPSHRFFVASSQYHVEAGPVVTQKDADHLKDQMIDSGYRDARIVID
jgi:rare lipoprotein A